MTWATTDALFRAEQEIDRLKALVKEAYYEAMRADHSLTDWGEEDRRWETSEAKKALDADTR